MMRHKILKPYVMPLFCVMLFFLTSAVCFATERYKTFSTVGLIIERENNGKTEILLQKRKNTGWMDRYWELGACGHVDEGETAKEAAVREAKEELGIDIKKENLEFAGLNHNSIEEKGIYYCIYFKVKSFDGTPGVGEPEKCETIAWFPTDNLPEKIIPIRETAIENYKQGILYDELDW